MGLNMIYSRLVQTNLLEVVTSFAQKHVFQKKQNVKAFDIIKKDETKEMTEHISRDCKCKFNSTTCN